LKQLSAQLALARIVGGAEHIGDREITFDKTQATNPIFQITRAKRTSTVMKKFTTYESSKGYSL